MPIYTVYAGYGENRRMVRIYSFEKPDDLTAETFVLARLTDQPVELWCRSRKVAYFEGKKAC